MRAYLIDIYSTNYNGITSYQLTKIPEYDVLVWEDDSYWVNADSLEINWITPGKKYISMGDKIIEQRKVNGFYIIRCYTGAHASIMLIIAPQVKNIFVFSSNAADNYYSFNSNGNIEAVSVMNDNNPTYAEGTHYMREWIWDGETFKQKEK